MPDARDCEEAEPPSREGALRGRVSLPRCRWRRYRLGLRFETDSSRAAVPALSQSVLFSTLLIFVS